MRLLYLNQLGSNPSSSVFCTPGSSLEWGLEIHDRVGDLVLGDGGHVTVTPDRTFVLDETAQTCPECRGDVRGLRRAPGPSSVLTRDRVRATPLAWGSTTSGVR